MNVRVMRSMVGGVLLGTLSAAQAASLAPVEQAFRGKPEIPDAALGEMRGRYISADQILYFGVEMYTEWHTAAGDAYGASLNIGIDRSSGSARPTTIVTSSVHATTASNGTSSTAASSGQISSGGLNQVQGVSQVVQVTGNGNGVANAIGVDVTTQRPTAGGSAAAQSNGNRLLIDPQSGASVQTYINRSGAGISITVPTQGAASQAVASTFGMQQQAQVYGDANAVHNQLNLVIQVQDNTLGSTRMNNILQSVPGL